MSYALRHSALTRSFFACIESSMRDLRIHAALILRKYMQAPHYFT
jgi:hypothetical protein